MQIHNRLLVTRFLLIMILAYNLASGIPSFAALPTDWQEWSVNDLLTVSTPEQWAALEANEQMAVTDFAWSRFIYDGGVSASIGLPDFLRLTDRFRDRLNVVQQTELATVFQNRMRDDTDELTTLGVWDIWRIRRIAGALEIPNKTIAEWTRTYLMNNTTMLNDAGDPELGLLLDWANDVENDLNYDMSSTRRAVTDYIKALPVDSGSQDPSAIYAQLRVLNTAIINTDEEERSQYAQQVTNLIETNHIAFLGMTLWDHHYLRKVSYKAGVDKHIIYDWTLDWTLNGDAWMHGCTYQEVNTLHDWLREARARPMGRDAERRLVDYLADRLMVDPSELAMVDEDGMGLSRVVRSLAPRLDEEELSFLADYAADRFVRHTSIGGQHWDYENIASLFDSHELRQNLRERVVDPEGNPRINIAKLINWMYRGTPVATQWRDEIDLNTNDDRLPASSRARWLLARADAAAPEGLSINDPKPAKTPRMYAEEALSLAQDDDTRLLCLKWIVADDIQHNRLSDSQALIDANVNVFTTDKLAAEVQAIQLKIKTLQSSN